MCTFMLLLNDVLLRRERTRVFNYKLLLSRSIGSCRSVAIDAEVEGGGKRSAHHECF